MQIFKEMKELVQHRYLGIVRDKNGTIRTDETEHRRDYHLLRTLGQQGITHSRSCRNDV